MRRKTYLKPITLLLFLLTFMSYGQEGHSEEHSTEEPTSDLKTEIKEYIQHHLKDSYDFSLFLIQQIMESTNTSDFRYQ